MRKITVVWVWILRWFGSCPRDGSFNSRTSYRTIFFVRVQLVLLLAWEHMLLMVSPCPNGSLRDRGTEQVLVTWCHGLRRCASWARKVWHRKWQNGYNNMRRSGENAYLTMQNISFIQLHLEGVMEKLYYSALKTTKLTKFSTHSFNRHPSDLIQVPCSFVLGVRPAEELQLEGLADWPRILQSRASVQQWFSQMLPQRETLWLLKL